MSASANEKADEKAGKARKTTVTSAHDVHTKPLCSIFVTARMCNWILPELRDDGSEK